MTRSATPSPVRSPAATNTPPVKSANGFTSNSPARVFPSSPLAGAVAPGPVPAAMSGTPSPLKSPTAVRTPPVVPGNGSADRATDPSGLYAVTPPAPPVPPPTATRGDPTRFGTDAGVGGTGGRGGNGGNGGG